MFDFLSKEKKEAIEKEKEILLNRYESLIKFTLDNIWIYHDIQDVNFFVSTAYKENMLYFRGESSEWNELRLFIKYNNRKGTQKWILKDFYHNMIEKLQRLESISKMEELWYLFLSNDNEMSFMSPQWIKEDWTDLEVSNFLNKKNIKITKYPYFSEF